MEVKYKGGVIRSPEDARDFSISSAMDFPHGATTASDVELPDEFEVWTPPNYDQGAQGSCVACTLSAIYDAVFHKYSDIWDYLKHIMPEYEEFIKQYPKLVSDEYNQHSIGFVYGNRMKDKWNHYGMIPRYACDNTLETGNIFHDMWDSTTEVPMIISAFTKAYEEFNGMTTKVFSKYVSFNSYDEIRAFIYKYKIPVMICTESDNIYPKSEGGHAILCYGWRKDGNKNLLKFQNSWGTFVPKGEIDYHFTYDRWGLVPKIFEFKDLEKDAWYYDYIVELAMKGIACGYTDGTIRPNENITRAEFITMLARSDKIKQ